jgi:hypothetical protein
MNARRTRPAARRGYGMIELAMAVFLLMAAMGLMVKALAAIAAERVAADRRLWAAEATSNVMERVAAEPFEAVTVEKARSIAADAHADRALPGAAWEVSVEDEPAGPAASKRVALRLKWKDRWGGWDAPVRLTGWVFRGRGRS